jgi:hypothetical protein
MSKKQTAVEWLFEISKKRELDKFDLEQAKAMHKDQIIMACDAGFEEGSKLIEDITLNDAEQYYNETYGK